MAKHEARADVGVLPDDAVAWTLAYDGSPTGVVADSGSYRCPACGELLSLGSMPDSARLRINCNSAGAHQWTAEGPNPH